MFNLLPENIRRVITIEYRMRLFIIVIVFIIALEGSLLIFLFPSWLNSYYKEKDVAGRTEDLNDSLSTLDINTTTSFIKSVNNTLKILDDNLEYPKFVPVLDNLLSKKSSSIRLSGINYNVDTRNAGKIVLTGVGASRESLVSFSDRLKGIDYLKKVDLPISNLAKDKDINFTISITLEK